MKKVALIGCGKMGSALLRGWNALEGAFSFYVLDHSPVSPPVGDAAFFSDPAAFLHAVGRADIVVLAVKPQAMEDACCQIGPCVGPDTLVLSIAAGKTIGTLESLFGLRQPIVRCMPNTPAAIGKGITVAVPSPGVSTEQRADADRLLSATGQSVWIENEDLMDAVTALSGSGPAYVFLLIEVLAAAGEKLGLPAPVAAVLARQTVIGSAALAEHDTLTEAAQLRANVTSPGGTTEAALAVLMAENGLQPLFDDALDKAASRGRALRQAG